MIFRNSSLGSQCQLLELRPGYANEVREDIRRFADEKLFDRMVVDLRKAGLDVPDEPPLTQ